MQRPNRNPRRGSEGWPDHNPYIRDFATPVNRNEVLPRAQHHALLKCVQALVEGACFAFAQRHMPRILVEKDWQVPEDGELNEWWTALQGKQTPVDSVAFPAGANVAAPFGRLAHLRHAAVHRLRAPVDIIKRMLQDAIFIVSGLLDELRSKKLRYMQQALCNNDLELLDNHISKSLQDFELLQMPAPIPLQLPGEDRQKASAAWYKSYPAVANGPLASRPQNIPRRRSFSPLRSRPEGPRRPLEMQSTNRRLGGDFVDLTGESEDETPANIHKERRSRHSAPANFIDLTED